MSPYVDTSIVVSFLLIDGQHQRARSAVEAMTSPPIISSWTMAEFVSVAKRDLRDGRLPKMAMPSVLQAFDAWCRRVDVQTVGNSDLVAAYEMLRSDTKALRAPDALHLAICRRLGAPIATFDAQMATAAREVGVSVVAV